ncbi:MAG TPA: 50S ribosome-binding GTPase, partial [Candidatus Blautia merdavium]|nr:50S ribosome-binding GTPase [Candidatus Blautia merdavium]
DPPKKKSLFRRLIDYIIAFFCRLFSIPLQTSVENAASQDQDYKAAIQKCAEIAKDDFTVVRPCYEAVISKCSSIVHNLQEQQAHHRYHSKLSDSVSEIVSDFAQNLSDSVLSQSQKSEAELLQKERTLPDFTISLLGRTKAGKTTLHAILTGEGRDKIGSGLQRTTRYNRVYQWNLLRLIDTPGFGSAEAAGRSDDEIAAAVLDESDIICFVVVDEGIQKDILEFIQRASKRNKPIIILLNHKQNIRDSVHFKRFLQKPTDWLTTTGEANLQGYSNRIYRFAQENGFGNLISVYPVFLLAALMAQEPEYTKYSKLLWESSNLEPFIEKLKSWITFSGPLKRSQTLLDGTIQDFSHTEEKLQRELLPINQEIQALQTRWPATVTTIRKEQQVLMDHLKDLLDERFSRLKKQEALNFATQYFDCKDDLSSKWTEYLDSIHFERTLEEDVKELTNQFLSKVDNTVRDFLEDFYFAFSSDLSLDGGQKLSFNFRLATNILASLMDAGGLIASFFIPFGWVIAIPGAILHILSRLFTSQAEKRKQAIDALYGKLSSQIEEKIPSWRYSITEQIHKQTEELIQKSDRAFSSATQELNDVIHTCDGLANIYTEQRQHLNQVYAWRILTFMEGKVEMYADTDIGAVVHDVERLPGLIRIHTPLSITIAPDALKDVISEQIEIVGTETVS